MSEQLKIIEVKEDKSPVNGFKTAKKPLEELENAAIELNSKVVVADFDGDNVGEDKIMNYFEENYPTLIVKTDKGKHFYHARPQDLKINSKADSITVGGFQCDYKTGHQYVLIKRYGKIRETNQKLTLENLPDLPFLMYPLKSTKNITPINMTGFKEGNGRNIGMFNHLYCVRKQYGDEELENVANFINNNIFAEPLDEKELNNIIESVMNYEVKKDKDTESWMDKAESVINELQCVWFENDIMFFDEESNYYCTDTIKMEHYIQKKYRDTSNFRISGIKEVIGQMACILANNPQKFTRNETYILCGKELVNVTENEIIANTRTIVTDVIYPYSIMRNEELDEYEKNKKIGWKFLEDVSCGNPEMKKVICECLGCMLSPVNPFGKIFIWYGNGANGKSVLIKVMKAIMGNLLTSANLLKVNDKYTLSRAYKGIANVTDDVGITEIKETGILKSIIDGSTIEIERKYLDPIEWEPNSQFVMCCNDLPKIKDTSKGMLRRLAFIPFELQLKDNEIDRDLINKLLGKSKRIDKDEQNYNALRYIMTKAIISYRQAFQKGNLTETEKQKDLLKDFEEENKDDVALFFEYLVKEHNDIKGLCEYLKGRTYHEVFAEYAKYIGFEVTEKETEQEKKMRRSFLINFNRKLPSNVKKKKVNIGGTSYDTYDVL